MTRRGHTKCVTKKCHKRESQKSTPKKVSEKCMVILANLVHLVNLVRPYVQIYAIDRVVVRSRSQIVKPDALFVVFLGIKWAHDIVKKNRS